MLTEVKVNPKYVPTFQNKEHVILTRNGGGYCDIPDFENIFFKKDRVCRVIKCGLSHFFVDKKFQPLELVEDCEWCTIEAEIEEKESGHQFFDEEGFVAGVIRAKDLRKRTVEDIEKGL